MVLIFTPLHDLPGFAHSALPIAEIPDYLENSVRQAAEHHDRILLPEFSFKPWITSHSLREELHDCLKISSLRENSDGSNAEIPQLAVFAPIQGSLFLKELHISMRDKKQFKPSLPEHAFQFALNGLPCHSVNPSGEARLNLDGLLIFSEPCFISNLVEATMDQQVRL